MGPHCRSGSSLPRAVPSPGSARFSGRRRAEPSAAGSRSWSGSICSLRRRT